MVEDKVSIYMTLAYLVAMQSKDQFTWVGAVIIGSDNEIRSTGYNGLPRGCDDFVEHRNDRPEKYYWFEHAERNAIYNSVRMGLTTKDCTMYTQGTPCADCARAIIQSGIKEVVVHKQWDMTNSEKWSKSGERSLVMFEESGVLFREWDGEILMIESMRHGKNILSYNILFPSMEQ